MVESGFLFGNPDKTSRSAQQGTSGKARARSAVARKEAAATEPSGILTVTQLTRMIKLTLQRNLPGRVVLTGEISKPNHHPNGHLYMTIKDDNSQIRAVMWRSAAARLKFKPAHGMAVVATGRVDVYETQGEYQLYVDKLEPSGTGALELAYRQMCEKLRREGLFEAKYKKPIPRYPATIAIVTSAVGAAVQDIEKTLNSRYRIVRRLLYPVSVQGDAAAGEIAAAIGELNRRRAELGGIDVMIVGRGGGSLEDLWAFNEEIVARAIFASEIPVISAVGHESDTTVADLVADVRAHTPTDAAEQAVPVLLELLSQLSLSQSRLDRAVRLRLQGCTSELKAFANRPCFTRPLDGLHQRQQLLDERGGSLTHLTADRMHRLARALESHATTLRRIEPNAALANARGRLAEQRQLLNVAVKQLHLARRRVLDGLDIKLKAAGPQRRTGQQRMVLSHLSERMGKGHRQLLHNSTQRLGNYRARLMNLDPRAVLRRGYSITRDKASGAIVRAQARPQVDDVLTTELADDVRVDSKVIAASGKNRDNRSR